MSQNKTRARSRLGAAIVAALLLPICATSVAARPDGAGQAGVALDQLTVPQLELAATNAATQGHGPEALVIADALLRRDPDNSLGHFIVGQIMLAAGKTDIARAAADRSFANAGTPRQRYEAARLAAKVAVADKRWFAAQYWARHTIQYAPDEARRKIAVSDYQVLKVQSPWDYSIRAGIRPSDNVNGGAAGRTNVIDGYDAVGLLSEDAQALPGVAATLNADVGYRIAADQDSLTKVGASLYLREVDLSGDPKMTRYDETGNPLPPVAIRNSEFSEAALGISLDHIRQVVKGTVLSLGTEVGRNWQEGSAAYDYGQLNTGVAHSFAGGLSLGFGGSVEARDWIDSPRDDLLKQVGIGLTQPLGWGKLGLALSAAQLSSTNDLARSWSVTGGVNFEPTWQLGAVRVGVGAGLSTMVYPDYALAGMRPAGGRQDDASYAELDFWAPKYGYAAFAPEVKVQALRVDSNISRFTRSELSLALGWRSSF